MQQGAKISQARLSVLMGRTGSRSRKALPKNSSGLVKNKAPGAPRSTNTLRFLEATIKHNDTPHFCSAAATGAQSPATSGAPGRATTDQSLARIVPAQPGTRDCPCPAWTVPEQPGTQDCPCPARTVPAQPALGTGKNLGLSLPSLEPGTSPAGQPGTRDQPCQDCPCLIWNPGLSLLPSPPWAQSLCRDVPELQGWNPASLRHRGRQSTHKHSSSQMLPPLPVPTAEAQHSSVLGGSTAGHSHTQTFPQKGTSNSVFPVSHPIPLELTRGLEAPVCSSPS